MRKSTLPLLVAIFSVVAVAHVSGARSPEEIKNYLVGYLKTMPENNIPEDRLSAKENSELFDIAMGILEKRKAAVEPNQAKLIGKHIDYLQDMKIGKSHVPKEEPEVHRVGSQEDFKNHLAKAGDKLVVVDFFATWCGPCKRIAPTLERMAQELHGKVHFVKVDVDEMTMDDYRISSMPTFLFIKNGQELERFSGASEENLRATIQKHIN